MTHAEAALLSQKAVEGGTAEVTFVAFSGLDGRDIGHIWHYGVQLVCLAIRGKSIWLQRGTYACCLQDMGEDMLIKCHLILLGRFSHKNSNFIRSRQAAV